MSFDINILPAVHFDFFYLRPLKAFINERKHQKPPRKVAKQKKTHQAAAQSDNTEKVHSIQESSSQSSSYDMTGPDTSSHSGSDTTSVLRVEDDRSETKMSQMDPHFARLLGSLALSAAAASESVADGKSSKATGNGAKSITSSHATNSDRSADSPFASHSHGVDPYKGSSPLPSQLSQQPVMSSRAQYMHDNPTLDSPRSHNTPSTLIRPKPSLNGIASIEENLSTLNKDRTAYQAPRRVSTADISPYLTRATDQPISATRLKQLSLLETIADESARMSSVIATRAAMNSANPVNGYPLPPLSVPPPQSMMLGNMRDPGVIYSSDHLRVSSYVPGFQPIYNSSEHGEHDAFQVRSRTSQSFHRNLTHNPTSSVSNHQNYLLAAMNGSHTPSLNSSEYSPHFIQHQPPQIYHAGSPINGSRYITPPHFSPAPQPLPSAVADCTLINRGQTTVNPPYNPSLLSILNARSRQPPNVPAQFH